MSRYYDYASGTSAYDLDRCGALPEIQTEEERQYEARPQRTPTPAERERMRPRTNPRQRARARRARRPGASAFGVLGVMAACVLLLMIVLSHMQLAVISSEMGQLEREMSTLRAEGLVLQAEHDHAFSQNEVERIARQELGMVDATRGQIVFIGSGISGDVAEVLRVEEESNHGLLDHMAGLFGTLRESWSSIFGR